MAPGSSYVAAPRLAIGTAPRLASPSLSRTVAFDRAEAAGANVTQTNMVRVSSFNGPYGLLLGHDLLTGPLLPSPLASERAEAMDAAPLFAATEALFGSVAEPRFPIMPGSHLLCAYKEAFLEGPGLLYAAFAIGTPEDRGRDADLFMEDVGTLNPAMDAESQRREIARTLLDSVALVGGNLRVRYPKVFVGVEVRLIAEGHVGCALAAAPYVNLAGNAIPAGGVREMAAMSVAEWETEVSGRFLGQLSEPVAAGGR